MKLLHHLIPITLVACGTTSSPDPSTGCTSDSDCKSGRVCLEGKCTVEDTKDVLIDAVEDAGINPFENIPLKGKLYATIKVQDKPEAVIINFDQKTILQLGSNGVLLDSSQAQHLRNLNRPTVVNDKLLFVNNGETPLLQSYNLHDNTLTTLFEVYSGTEITGKGDEMFYFTTQSHSADGLERIIVTEGTWDNNSREVAGINAKSLFFGYMGVAYDKTLNQLYFTCPATESRTEEDQDDPADPVYQHREICVTFGSQRNGAYHVMTDLKNSDTRVLTSLLTVYEFRGSEQKGVFFACTTNEGSGFCSVKEGKDPILEIPLETPANWLVFDPSQKYAALADGRIYDFESKEFYNLNDFNFQLNGEIVREIIPFEWE